MSISESRSRLAGKRSVVPATIDGLDCERLGWRTSARPILTGRLRQLTSWETARWRLMNESLMLMDCMLTDLLWWMCEFPSFHNFFSNEYAPKCRFCFVQ